MRHIPEEELHAYLDQALSRSQCVEIERHLARCTRCRMAREEIAAVRDRTTDLLAVLGPTPFLSPPFEQIRTGLRRRQQRRRRILALAAAGIAVVALVQAQPGPPPAVRNQAPAVEQPRPVAMAPARLEATASPTAPAPARVITTPRHSPAHPAAPIAKPSGTQAALESTGEPAEPVEHKAPLAEGTFTTVSFEDPRGFADPSLPGLGQVSEIETRPVDPFPTPPGLWLTVGTDNLGVAVPAGASRIPGLPVVQVRVQPGVSGSDVVAVDQLLESGEVVRTISGPPERVHTALAGDGEFHDANDDSWLTVTIRQADRMVAVTGPADILGTLLSTSGLRRRY